MAKKLGIDLGSSSLGWFLREDDKILKNGVVTFNSGMIKDKSGGYTSPTRDRRIARSKRRLIQARKYRKWKLLDTLIGMEEFVPLTIEELETWSRYKKGLYRRFPESDNFIKWLACDFTYNGSMKYKNPYELRVKAIDNKVSKHELGRILYHLVQRRGYKDIGEKDKETKTQIERRGTSGFDLAIKKNRTLAEALKNDFLEKGLRARNEYPYRAEYEKELIHILGAQGFDTSLNDKKDYKDEFVNKIRNAIIWQRPLRSQKGNIGRCTLEPTKQRCPASHPVFEIFRAWQYINTIRTVENIDEKHKLSKEIPIEYRRLLFKEIFIKQEKNFKFDTIQKFLDRHFKERREYNYLNKSTKKYDSTAPGMPICKGLISLFGSKVETEIYRLHTYGIDSKGYKVIGNYSVYDIWHLIFNTDNDHLEDFAIKKLGISSIKKTNKEGDEYLENPVVRFKNSTFPTSYANLSIKAMCKIIPFLQEGFTYDDAVLLAKVPEFIDNWNDRKDLVYGIINDSNQVYNYNKDIVYIANSLIDKYKGLTSGEDYAYKDYKYKIKEDDIKQVEKACISFYGEKTWGQEINKQQIIDNVTQQYQDFFFDEKREYRKIPTYTKIIKEQFEINGIQLRGELYHHSDRENKYLEKLPIDKKTGKHKLPKHFATGETILPIPVIDSIKNPMFNKAMSILRKLINELIIQKYTDENDVTQSYIDENTEVIIEVARELNDNNKRIAIEKYQRERRDEREKIRMFLNEFKENNAEFSSIDTEEKIPVFEMWEEQTFQETIDERGNIITNHNPEEIRKEKDAIKRYQLWIEQKGQCMYTGKMISISQLFSTDIEIEHTIPRSLLPDNTMANLTVCYSRYNSDVKNNRIPKECPNFDTEKDLPKLGKCTPIEPRLEKWEKLRDHYKNLYKDNSKPFGNEDENRKNTRIQSKHYYKLHYDYWKDKVERFTVEEVKESWVRRQLTDTQMVSKYAREFLKTYFKKVLVQKGSTTSDYRKIFGIQGEEKKDRSKHTHHCIDAAVLTLIPTNSSKRVELLQQLYKEEEQKQKITRKYPEGFYKFDSQSLIDIIENETLIVNYEKDKITEQTYRNVRKRGKRQCLRDKEGTFKLDENGERIILKAKGSSIRGDLFKDTYIGKIKNVERDENDKPKRENGDWKYIKGTNEFLYTVRKPIEEVQVKLNDIIDPDIKRLIEDQLKKGKDINNIIDHQGNKIRHVRIKTNAGKKVKDRVNFKSKYEYKNAFYSTSGEIPYAIFITNIKDGRIERNMIPVAIHEIAQVYKDIHKFDIEFYLDKFYPEIQEYQDKKLLKVGQKVFVLKEDLEYEERFEKDFQKNRMYMITKFSEGSIWLQFHQEARDEREIDENNKLQKDSIVMGIEKKHSIPEVSEDESILDFRNRKNKYLKERFSFNNYTDFRLERLIPVIGKEEVVKLRSKLRRINTVSSEIDKDIIIPFLKINRPERWNFLIENYDFNIDITGKITWFEG
jgi:CRISPR-associated endonuclease Csn1